MSESRSAKDNSTLPARLRVLHVEQGSEGWLERAFELDGSCDVSVYATSSVQRSLAVLREESFDAILIDHRESGQDAYSLVEVMRTGSHHLQPIIVIGEVDSNELKMRAYESGADAYLSLESATTRTVLWEMVRAVDRSHLLSEMQTLKQAQRHQVRSEHDEALRLLKQQRSMIADLERLRFASGHLGNESAGAARRLGSVEGDSTSSMAGTSGKGSMSRVDSNRADANRADPDSNSPEWNGTASPSPSSENSNLGDLDATESTSTTSAQESSVTEQHQRRYRELLQAYVIMGAGSLSREMEAFVGQLAELNLRPQVVMQLHLQVVEGLVSGLGSRSARHLVDRADLLILEVMVSLADIYRQQSLTSHAPAVRGMSQTPEDSGDQDPGRQDAIGSNPIEINPVEINPVGGQATRGDGDAVESDQPSSPAVSFLRKMDRQQRVRRNDVASG